MGKAKIISIFVLSFLFIVTFSAQAQTKWLDPALRIDLGDSPGAERSWWPQIACSDYNVYSVWYDGRNSGMDIYFNTSALPHPDIQANGSDGPVTITRTDTLTVTVEMDSGTHTGENCDWWLVVKTPVGWYHYDLTQGWLPVLQVTFQGPLRNLAPMNVFNQSGLPAAVYHFYFGVDLVMNGTVDLSQGHYDRITVTINP